MTTLARDLREDAICHAFNRGIDHMDIFLDSDDFRFYLNRLKICQEEYGFELYAVCLMTNHYHIVIKADPLDLSLIMDAINSVYVRYFNKKYNREGPLFGEPYKHSNIFTEAAFVKLIRYVNRNPVAAGMTNSIYDYPWVLVIPEKDPLNLINFSYIDEAFLNICQLKYEKYLMSDEDDLWVDDIELTMMDYESAEILFNQIVKKMTGKEKFNKRELSEKEKKDVIYWACRRKISLRQISAFTGHSVNKIIRIRDSE